MSDGETGATGRSSRDEMSLRVEQHLPLVRHIVFQVAVHFPRHVDREELARAGALGLVEAAGRYDHSRGVPFDRFAATRIRGAILDAVRAADWAPRSVRNLSRRLEQVEQRLASQLGRLPSLQELADALDIDPSELSDLQNRMFRSVVLALEYEVNQSAPGAGDEEDLTLVDILRDRSTREPSEELEFRELRAYLRDAVKLLPERQRLVIVGYFLEGRTSQDLAQFLGVTESRVSQLRSEALEALKEGIEAQYRPHDGDEPAQGRVARRKASYAAAIGSASGWRARVSSPPTDGATPRAVRLAG
jgi:RNA polymerase sigma factor for flagellar operon FliA